MPTSTHTAAKSRRRRKTRSPGRPAGGNGDHRERLLDAAQASFARTGFTGSSLRQIARDARVTPALTHYYFTDKAGLLEAVIADRVAPLVEGIVAEARGATDPKEAVAAFVQAYTLAAARNPWLPQLVMREVLSEQGVLREAFVSRFAAALASLLKDLIARGQRQDVFRKDLAPAAIVMSLMSLCVFPFIAAPLITGALGIEVDTNGAKDLARHHLAVFFDGIEAEL